MTGPGNPHQALLPGVVEKTSGMTVLLMRSRRMNLWIGAAIAMLATLGTAAVWAQGL